MRKLTQTNTLQRGELSSQDATAPLSKAYFQGGLEVRGFDIRPRGLTAMRVPVASDDSRAFRYRAHRFGAGFFLRNTSSGINQDNDTLPTETVVTAKSIGLKITELTNLGQMRAGLTDPTDPGFLKHRDTGRYNVADRGSSVGRLIIGTDSASIRTLVLTEPTRIYRAFFPCMAIGANGDQVASSWGLHAARRVTRKHYWELGGIRNDESSSSELTYGCARGSASGSQARIAANILRNDHTEVTQGLEILSEVLPPGTYQFNEDVWLAGTPAMFREAPQDREYMVEESYGNSTSTVKLTEDREWTSQKALVLAWGQVNAPTTHHTGAWTMPAYTKLDDSGMTEFWFTGRTILVGSRRFGAAQFQGDGAMFGATEIGLMGGSADDGRVVPTTGPITGEKAYVLKLDSGLVWLEQIAQGILFGTTAAEYILSVPQINPASGSGGSLQRISAVGSPGVPGDAEALSASANLSGDVFYISRFGITTLDFSNEGQVYLPRNFEFRGRRFASTRCTSLAANVAEHCLYLSFDDGSAWKLWPDIGALAEIPLSLPVGAKLAGVIERDGTCWLLVAKADGSRYVCPVAQARAQESYLKTTAFGRAPGSRAQIKRVVITGNGLRAGVVGLETKEYGLPLTAPELAGGFDGSKELRVSDRPARSGEGKSIVFRWNSLEDELEDPGTLVSITVEMEV